MMINQAKKISKNTLEYTGLLGKTKNYLEQWYIHRLVKPLEYRQYVSELAESNMLDYFQNKRQEFNTIVGKNTTSRGNQFSFGSISENAALNWYSVIRKFKPKVIVETGVCNGISTAVILMALKNNDNDAYLYSIDYPEYAKINSFDDNFWNGKGGAVIPSGKEPGWLIPNELKTNWKLIIGKSTDELRPLLINLKHIDFFLHDSEHSYECMMY